MTRMHFKAIARALKAIGADKSTCLAIAIAIAPFNTRFDRAMFLQECGQGL